jgi:GDPmannose 4,6-dehydratase
MAMKEKTVCITGISGQIGSYLAEIFLEKGFKVYGLKRRTSSINTQRIDHIFANPNLKLVYGDITDSASITNFINDIQPDYYCNAAAQSHVSVSFTIPVYTMEATGTSVLIALEALRKHSPKTKFITFSSSEMFGSTPPPQNEKTIFHPRSPYAVAKLVGYNATVNYREAYGMFACNAISFNSESPRRGETFVTKKITKAAARIKLGLQDKLYLGNLAALRDWSHAQDTANAVYTIVTADKPDDFVVASGEVHSVQEFVEIVFAKLDLDWKKYVEIDTRLFRPSEVDALCGDSSKLRNTLGWTPKFNFEDIVSEMTEYDLIQATKEKNDETSIK